MAIDVFSERVITFKEAISLLPKLPRSNKLHISTLYRWSLSGLRSKDRAVVRLEVVKVGGSICTSQEALQRFFDRLTGDTTVVTPPTPTTRERLRQIQEAEELCRRAGI